MPVRADKNRLFIDIDEDLIILVGDQAAQIIIGNGHHKHGVSIFPGKRDTAAIMKLPVGHLILPGADIADPEIARDLGGFLIPPGIPDLLRKRQDVENR